MKAEERTRYFQELARCLRHEGLTPKPETADGFLPVELDSMYLCRVSDAGTVRYWPEDTADEYRSAAVAGHAKRYFSLSQKKAGNRCGSKRNANFD